MNNYSVEKPFPYYGAKDWLVPLLLEIMPPHKIYIERFLGSGAIFCAKPLVELNILNDLDIGVYNFWVILKNFSKFLEDIERIDEWSLFEDFTDQRKKKLFRIIKNEAKYYRIEKVPDIKGFFLFFIKQFFGYDSVSWHPSDKFLKAEKIDIRKYYDRWFNVEKKLNSAEVIILNKDFREINYDGSEVLIYDDPPYLQAVERGYYGISEVTPEEVANDLRRRNCKFIVSYNNSSRVLKAFEGFNFKLIKAPYQSRIEWEVLITNFAIEAGQL